VVIETPKGSRNKYAFDEKQKIFALKKVLPAGMAFPYDFGFIPSTIAEDGDPVDVLALMDEPGAVGCLLQCRVVGIIEGEQGKKKDAERNVTASWPSSGITTDSPTFVTSKIWVKNSYANWKISS